MQTQGGYFLVKCLFNMCKILDFIVRDIKKEIKSKFVTLGKSSPLWWTVPHPEVHEWVNQRNYYLTREKKHRKFGIKMVGNDLGMIYGRLG